MFPFIVKQQQREYRQEHCSVITTKYTAYTYERCQTANVTRKLTTITTSINDLMSVYKKTKARALI